MKRILLVENPALPLHRLRIESRRSGVSFLYDSAASSARFDRLLAQRPVIVVGTLDPIPGLPLAELAGRTRLANLPLFLVGGDTQEERELLTRMAGQFSACCRRTRLQWLPILLERAVREFYGTEHPRNTLAPDDISLPQGEEQLRQIQKLALVGRLTGSIVHEINGPLESITNLTYLLSSDDQLPDHLRRYVEMAEQELKRVAQISKQTLSFYRESLEPVRTSLSTLLEEVVILYGHRLCEKQIDLARQYEPEEPVLIYPGEMRQVYANLLANAIEATPPGGKIVLRVHLAHGHAAGGNVEGVRVLVADSGSGITPEALLKLGQPFFTTKGQRGTGLGLWVSQAIVKRYGGAMQLRSSTVTKRHGSTFSIFLPLNLPARKELPLHEVTPAVEPPIEKKTVKEQRNFHAPDATRIHVMAADTCSK